MSKKDTTPVEHRDCLGRLLKVGDCVAVAHHNGLMVGVVKKLNNKMIKVGKLSTTPRAGEYNKYASECALLEGPEVTMFLLKTGGKK